MSRTPGSPNRNHVEKDKVSIYLPTNIIDMIDIISDRTGLYKSTILREFLLNHQDELMKEFMEENQQPEIKVVCESCKNEMVFTCEPPTNPIEYIQREGWTDSVLNNTVIILCPQCSQKKMESSK